MATNRRFYPADHLELPVVAGTLSGDPVMVGDLPGVATTDRDAAGNASVALKGAYLVTVTAGVGALSVGQPVNLVTPGHGQPLLTTGGKLFGHVVEGALNAAATGQVTVKISTP